MRNRAHLLIFLFALVFLAGSTGCEKSGVQAARDTDLTAQKILSLDDEKFLVAAERAELRQNTLAQQAEQRSKSAKIQAFATKVTNDMSVALTELKDLMKAKNLAEPAAFAAEVHSEAAVLLSRASDEAFDHQFISLMSAEGQDAVRIFDPTAETAADPDVRNYARRVVPSLRANYDKASDLEKTLAEKPAQ
jgi:putative membrane protein